MGDPENDREERLIGLVSLLVFGGQSTVRSWPCFPFIRPGQNHLGRHSEKGKKTRQTDKRGGKTSGNGKAGVRQVPEGSGEQRKWRKLV